MMTQYYKDNKEVNRPRSIIFNGATYINPTDEQLILFGYEIKYIEQQNMPIHKLTYEEKVVSLIRERYDINDEIAILRQRDSKPDEFVEYNMYCEKCKEIAKEEL